MKAAVYLWAIAASMALAACTVYEQPGRVYPPRYGYYYDHRDNDRYDHKRDHCPPGHRRKHWC